MRVHVVGLPAFDEARVWHEVGRTGRVVRLARKARGEWTVAIDERHVVPVFDGEHAAKLAASIYTALATKDNEAVGCALDKLLDYALPLMAQPDCPLHLRIMVRDIYAETRGRTWRS